MRFKSLLIAFLFGVSLLQAQDKVVAPKVYLNIVIDQLRTDFLYEFYNLYGDGGFKKLLAEGRVYPNSYFAFENVDRASAAATLATGTDPYVSGIVGEQWLDRKSMRVVSCVEDRKYDGHFTTLSFAPTKLKAITLTDEMKRASRGGAIVCSIAPDEDVAVINGGHAADVVLWKNNSAGFWSSSSYYGEFPLWASEMNRTNQEGTKRWEPLLSSLDYNYYGEKAPPRFSYGFSGRIDMKKYKTTACVNEEITELALSYIKDSKIGKDEMTDCLSLAFYAGNINGESMEERPVEIQDIYARIDRNIAAVIAELEKKVGADRLVVSLSSTGYVLENGEDGAKYRLPSGTIYMDRIMVLLNVYLSAIYGKGEYIEGVHAQQFYINNKLIDDMKLDKYAVVSHAIEFLKSVDGVEDVFTIYNLGGMLSPDLQYVKNGYNSSCSGDVWLRLMPGWKVVRSSLTSSADKYRTPVMFPMIIYGTGVKANVVEEITPANMLAVEMARILRIRRPNDNCLRVFK